MRYIFLIIFLLGITCPGFTQSLNVESYREPDDSLNKWPSYPGGNEEKRKFLSRHLEYPEDALEELIEGTVVIGFTVEKDGSITNVNVLRSVDPLLDAEALRVSKLMPKWHPGLSQGKTVRTRHKMDIIFKIPASYKQRKKMLKN